MAKKSDLCREIKRIKNIREKYSKKCSYSSIDSSRSDLDSDSFLSTNINREVLRQYNMRKEINKFDKVVTDNIKKHKNQHNDAIGYDPKFENKFILSSWT